MKKIVNVMLLSVLMIHSAYALEITDSSLNFLNHSAITSIDVESSTTKELIKSMGSYVLDTVKSDLCIGDAEVVQHTTLLSQALATSRLFGYNMLTMAPILYLSTINKIDYLPPLKYWLFPVISSCIIRPAMEEAVFTYIPQWIGKDCIKDSKQRSYLNLGVALNFAAAHYTSFNSYKQVIHAFWGNYLAHRYLLKRNSNLVPFFEHGLNNATGRIGRPLYAYYCK